jgi:hypothetical protein
MAAVAELLRSSAPDDDSFGCFVRDTLGGSAFFGVGGLAWMPSW